MMAALVESGLRFSVHSLTKDALRNSSQGTGTIIWKRAHQPGASISFSVKRLGDATARLHLSYARAGETIAYDVTLVAQQCRFGGLRWFALCPVTGRKASKLYLPPGARQFLARRAWRLAYASQNIASGYSRICNQRDRLLARKLKSDDPDFPLKPKGMRWSTFERHMEKLDRLHTAMDAAFLQRFGMHIECFLKNSGNFG